MNLFLTEQDLRRLSHNISAVAGAMKTALPHLSDSEGKTRDVAIRMIKECYERLARVLEHMRIASQECQSDLASPQRDLPDGNMNKRHGIVHSLNEDGSQDNLPSANLLRITTPPPNLCEQNVM